MVRFLWLILMLVVFPPMLNACSEERQETASENSKVENEYERKPLQITTQDGRKLYFQVEVAKTPEELTQGLMFRKEMAVDHGMIFIFPDVARRSFWMRNTYLPLDIIFLDETGKVLNIEQGTPLSETNVHSDGLSKAVIELNAGTAQKMGIQPGDQVHFPGVIP